MNKQIPQLRSLIVNSKKETCSHGQWKTDLTRLRIAMVDPRLDFLQLQQPAGSDNRGILPRPMPVYPPNHRHELANFQQLQTNDPMEQEAWSNSGQLQRTAPGLAPGFNLSPMLFPLTLSG